MEDPESSKRTREISTGENTGIKKRRLDRSLLKRLTHNDYTVGWVCALTKEQTAATAMLDERHDNLVKPPNDNNTYTLGSIGDHNIVIACLPKGTIGTNAAAAVAASMIGTFSSIRIGLMVGIGGGIPPKVKLGDVVVSVPEGQYPGAVQWDIGKAEDGNNFKRIGALKRPPNALLTALTKLETKHELYQSEILQCLEDTRRNYPGLTRYTRRDSLKDPLFSADNSYSNWDSSPDTRAHYGLIASGNQVIKDASVRDSLDENLDGNVLCVEMEAAGLMNHFPCIVIRGICDYANSGKSKDWQEYAAAVAAAYAKELLGEAPTSDIDGGRPVKEILNQVLETASKSAQDVAQVKSKLDRKEDMEILDWIMPFDYGPQHADHIRRRQPGTGQWLIDSPEYQSLLNNSQQLLFCPGIPGAGKTIITAIVIDDLFQRFRNDAAVGIAYIYCNSRPQVKQTVEHMLFSLLKQLTQQRRQIPREVKYLYDDHKLRNTRPQLGEICIALLSVAKAYSRGFLVVDALDECSASDGCRSRFLDEILNLQSKTGSNIILTSRFINDVTDRLRKETTLGIRASEQDVRKYLDKSMFELPVCVRHNQKLQEEIKSAIVKAADGMFLLTRLYLESLDDRFTIKAIESALGQFQQQS